MCKALCDAPEDSAMTCDACLDGVRSTIDQLVDTPTIEGIITALQVSTLLMFLLPTSVCAG